MNILLGSDPELFVKDNNVLVSAWGMVDGDKHNPLAVTDGAVQVDGMALEYNTNPASTLEEWEHNHVSVQSDLRAMLGEGQTLHALPTAFFADEVFDTSPKEALILGCEPDFNAYTGKPNAKPNGNVKFRTGAGHIHIGWGEGFDVNSDFHMGECKALAKMLDLHLGLPSVLLDDDNQRRKLYGAAGCFRPKSYGMEYRTLSNFWVEDAELRTWAYKATKQAIHHALDPKARAYEWVPHSINSNNKDNARYGIRNFELEVPHGL